MGNSKSSLNQSLPVIEKFETGHSFFHRHSDGPGTVHIVVDQDANLEDMVEAFRSYLLACGYHSDTIKGYFD